MNTKLTIGLLRETKNPPDRRVALPPAQAMKLVKKYPRIDLLVQRSELRCFTDQEYLDAGLTVVEDLGECDLLIGVKEVDKSSFLAGKSYLFFAHVGKKQPYNRSMLQEIVRKNITLLDYEYLTDQNNLRLVAFGRWAGIVGAYNGLRGFGIRNKSFDLKPAHECHDFRELISELKNVKLPAIKILITGGGRVARGALETLAPLNLKKVSPEEFLAVEFEEPVLCQIEPWHYTKRKDGGEFDLQHFFYYPEQYESTFKPYSKVTDLYIPCHFWDPRSPVFLDQEDYQDPDFNISVIADVSCDIHKPIASTIRASTIAEPFYGYDPATGQESDPWDSRNITVMAVDNLPGELPRDASEEFGETLIEKVLPAFVEGDKDEILKRATIVDKGKLTSHFNYLKVYLEGKEEE
jgi:saccharopine dehydrogenase (NAD+, L-lysine forming)